MLTSRNWSGERGGFRRECSKIPRDLEDDIKTQIWSARDLERPYAAMAVDWLKKAHNIVVTRGSIYTWARRHNLHKRRTRQSKQ